MYSINKQDFLKLLPTRLWLSDDCEIDETGIRLKKPFDEHALSLLDDDETGVLYQYKKDIQLNFPCALYEVKAWAERNGFGDSVDEFELLELLKEWQNTVAQKRANREPGTVTIDDLLEIPVEVLVEVLLKEIRPDNVSDKYLYLHDWGRACNKELLRVGSVPYADEARREDRKTLIRSKEKEIYWHLKDRPPIENAAAETPKSGTETVGDAGKGSHTAIEPLVKKLTKLEKQQAAILEVIKANDFNPMSIPDGKKTRVIQPGCENKHADLFNGSTSFDRAWDLGLKTLWQMENHESYARRGNN